LLSLAAVLSRWNSFVNVGGGMREGLHDARDSVHVSRTVVLSLKIMQYYISHRSHNA